MLALVINTLVNFSNAIDFELYKKKSDYKIGTAEANRCIVAESFATA